MSDAYLDEKSAVPRPFTDESLVSFAEYLDSKRLDGKCARFSDLQLMDIYKIAPYVYIFDIDHADGKWPLRFFGSKLVEAYGRDLTGSDIHDAIQGPERDALIQAMDKMIADRKSLWTIVTIETEANSDTRESKLVAYERLAYPLLGESGAVDHVISIVHVYPTPIDHPFQTRHFD